MNSLTLTLVFICSGTATAKSLEVNQGLEKIFCEQNPRRCGQPLAEPKTPKSQVPPMDITDQYKQQQYNARYKKVLIFKGCQSDPEACLMAYSNFIKVCPPGQYIIHGNGATVYTELSTGYIEDFLFRFEAEGRIAYIVEAYGNKRIHRVQANRYAPRGVGSYEKCAFPAPGDYYYLQRRYVVDPDTE